MSYKPPNTSGSSEHKVALTMDFAHATLPTGPFLVPQPLKHTKSEQVASFVGQVTNSLGMHSPILPPKLPYNAPSKQENITVIKPGPRARYVLPPSIVATSLASDVAKPSLPSPPNVPAGQVNQPSLLEINPLPSGHLSSSHNLGATVNLLNDQTVSQTTAPSFSTSRDFPKCGEPCHPHTPHWFYAAQVNGYNTWLPFSRHDSHRLETKAFSVPMSSPSLDSPASLEETPSTVVVAVEGGLYDVFLAERERRAVYWDEAPSPICRSTWFYRLPDEARIMPFPESMCLFLEARYKWTVEHGTWGQQFQVASKDQRGGDIFVFNSPQSMVQYLAWPYRGPHSVDTGSGAGYDTLHAPQSGLETTATELNGRVCHLRRGLDSQLLSQLDDGDYLPVDHVFFVIHGIGSVYNMKGEGLVSCVGGLRKTARQMAQTHFPHHGGRVEFLPVMWHDALHSDSTGVDEQLGRITLRSIPKLRQFTNNTLTDILFYTSPKFCQVIVDRVASEICRLHRLYLSRNPAFKGVFSLIGHSLGAVMAFDLLANQQCLSSETSSTCPAQSELQPSTTTTLADDDNTSTVSIGTKPSVDVKDDLLVEDVEFSDFCQPAELQPEPSVKVTGSKLTEELDGWSVVNFQEAGGILGRRPPMPDRLIGVLSRAGLPVDQIRRVLECWLATESGRDAPKVSSFWLPDGKRFQVPGSDDAALAGFGMPVVVYPQLGFRIAGLYMLGSPLPVFLTARGIRQLSPDYRLPTCSLVYNIFHPFDPVAYRMETIIEPMFQLRAVLIPHHKGRKRIHLQLKDNLARMGSDIKAKICQSVQSTWRSLQDFALSHRFLASSITSNMQGDETEDSTAMNGFLSRLAGQPGDGDEASEHEAETTTFTGRLNQGRRIDFVLQEAPLESFSDYLFALSSHAVYWESEDTVLFLLSEAYRAQSGIVPLASNPKKVSISVGPDSHSVSQTISTPPLPTHHTEAGGGVMTAVPPENTVYPNQPPAPQQQPQPLQRPPALFVCSPTSTSNSHSSDKAWQSNTSDTATTYSLAESSLSEAGFSQPPAPPLPPPSLAPTVEPPPAQWNHQQLDENPSRALQPGVATGGGASLILTYRHQRPRASPAPPVATVRPPFDFFQPTAASMPATPMSVPQASDVPPFVPTTAVPSMMGSPYWVGTPTPGFSPPRGGQPVHQLHPKPVSSIEPGIFPPTFPPKS